MATLDFMAPCAREESESLRFCSVPRPLKSARKTSTDSFLFPKLDAPDLWGVYRNGGRIQYARPEFQHILAILIINGARISEVLSMSCGEYVGLSSYIIEGKKGSGKREIKTRIPNDLCATLCEKYPSEKLFKVPYLRFYHFVSELVPEEPADTEKKRRVTHFPRQQFILNAFKTFGIYATQEKIGHVNIKNTLGYLVGHLSDEDMQAACVNAALSKSETMYYMHQNTISRSLRANNGQIEIGADIIPF